MARYEITFLDDRKNVRKTTIIAPNKQQAKESLENGYDGYIDYIIGIQEKTF